MTMRQTGIRIARCAVAAGLLLGGSAAASAQEPALFATFKTFCLDTNARTDAVKQAAQTAGAPVATGTDIVALAPPGGALTVWQLDRPEGKVAIAAAASRPDAIDGKAQPLQETCTIQSSWRDDAGVARIRAWLGVAPAPAPAPVGNQETYYFARRGDGSVAWAASAFDAQVPHPAGDNTMWMIMLVPTADGMSVNVVHMSPPDQP